jgi:hypothetical protein
MPLISANISFTVLFSIPFFFITTRTFMPTEGEAGPGFTFKAWRAECAFYWISTRYAPCTCSNISIFMLFANSIMYSWFPGDANQSVHIVADEGLEAYLPLADMVDVSEEVKRLSKRLSKMQSEYDALMARLNSQSVRAHFCLLHWYCSIYTLAPFHANHALLSYGVVCRKGPWRNCPWSSGKSIWGRGEDLSY